MKRTQALLLSILCSVLSLQASTWNYNFDEALKLAKQSNRHVLVNFSGSDWCGPCIRMKKEVFASDVFSTFSNKNLILVNADFPRYKKNKPSKEQIKLNEALAEKYNPKGVFPSTLLFTSEGKLLYRWDGLPKMNAEEFTNAVKSKLPEINKSENLRTFSKNTLLMGSRISVSILGEDEKNSVILIDSALNIIANIEKLISSWDEKSQTSLINKNAGIKPVVVDQELYSLIERSKKISELTQGAFDISFGSIDKNIWRFDGTMSKWPDSSSIKKSVVLINYRNIILNPQNHSVFLKNKGMRIGFGAIGKGYAAKKAKEFLVKSGVKNGVVNAGGDLICWGKQSNGNPWLISVADPREKHDIFSQIELNNMAAVTSGNYEKFIEINGEKYCHIIDPRTGYPVKNLQSVTIITKDPELADALATSVFVLGKDVGIDLIDQVNGVEGFIIDENNELITSKNINVDNNETN